MLLWIFLPALVSPVAASAVISSSTRAAEQKAQGYLGIEFHDVVQSSLGVFHFRPSHQIEIVRVDHDGPAGKAGLQSHDLVQSVNGQPVGGAEALRQMIHDAGAGATLALGVLRNGQPMTLNAQLESREDVERRAWAHVTVPSGPPADEALASDDGRSLQGSQASTPGRGRHFLGDVLHGPSVGVHLQVMPSQLATYFGAPASTGLLVESVEEGSPAALAGLGAGDVILRADAIVLHTLSDWSKRLHGSKGRVLSLVVLREHHEMTLSLQPNGARSALEWPFHF